MRIEQVTIFFAQQNRRYLCLPEAICFVAYLIERDGTTYAASMQEEVIKTGYYNISDNILYKSLKFYLGNGYCQPVSKKIDSGSGRPAKLYEPNPESAQIIQRLSILWKENMEMEPQKALRSGRGDQHRTVIKLAKCAS